MRPATQRLSSGASPPPVTTQWTWGWRSRGSDPRYAAPQARRPRPQVPGVGGHFEEGFRGGPHQQAVHLTGVVQRDRAESTGEREDDVEVRCVEQVGCLGLQPSRGGRGLALGAMAVATRVVGDFLVPALRALQDVSTQGRRAAGRARSSRARRCSGVRPVPYRSRNAS